MHTSLNPLQILLRQTTVGAPWYLLSGRQLSPMTSYQESISPNTQKKFGLLLFFLLKHKVATSDLLPAQSFPLLRGAIPLQRYIKSLLVAASPSLAICISLRWGKLLKFHTAPFPQWVEEFLLVQLPKSTRSLALSAFLGTYTNPIHIYKTNLLIVSLNYTFHKIIFLFLSVTAKQTCLGGVGCVWGFLNTINPGLATYINLWI